MTSRPAILALSLFCALSAASLAPAQDAAELRKEIQALKEGQAVMQKQLADLIELLKSAPRAAGGPAAPQNVSLAIDNSVLTRGDVKAPLVLVEFTDMQCPFCSRYAQTTFSQIENEYVKAGKLRYVVKNYPIDSLHPNAFRGAQANHCAAEQGRAWDMHDRLFANQQKLEAADIIGYADAMGMDAPRFKTCLETEKFADQVRKEFAEGQAAGVSGTPTFFLGRLDPASGKVKAERTLVGAQAFQSFKAVIDDLLSKK